MEPRLTASQVQEQWLQHGDEIGAGDSSFLFLLEDQDVAASGHVEFETVSVRRKPRSFIPRTWFICSRIGYCASCLRLRK